MRFGHGSVKDGEVRSIELVVDGEDARSGNREARLCEMIRVLIHGRSVVLGPLTSLCLEKVHCRVRDGTVIEELPEMVNEQTNTKQTP